MLDKASDYKELDIAGTWLARFISGNIMPVRDNRHDGSWRAMKFEDLLFLKEAARERSRVYYENEQHAIDSITQGLELPENRTISMPPVARIYNRFLNIAATGNIFLWRHAGFCNPRFVIPADGTVHEIQGYDIEDIFGSKYGPCSPKDMPTMEDVFGKSWPSTICRPMSRGADKLRICYWMVKNFTRSIYEFEATTPDSSTTWGVDSTEYSYAFSDDGALDPIPPRYEPNGQAFYGLYGASGGTYYNRDTYYIDYSSFHSNRVTSYLKDDSVVILFTVELLISGSKPKYFYVPFRSTMAGMGSTIESKLSGDYMARLIAGTAGVPFIERGTDPGRSHPNYVYISLRPVYVICNHEFPADIGGLNWNWSPSDGSAS